MSLQTTLLHYSFENPFMNASGISCMSIEELQAVERSAAGAVVTKSATLAPRDGNPAPRYVPYAWGSINSMGLPNRGVDYYLDYVLEQEAAHPDANPYFFSVAGMSIEENIALLQKVQDSPYQGITELNLSCPNVPGKPQVAYDFELTLETLTKIFSFFTKPLGLKLPPYFDLAQFDVMAEILNQFPLVYINTINSVGNGLVIDPETDTVVIKPKDGFGGLGGSIVKPTALANVRAFAMRLKPEIKIIGTGGITSGQDAYEHLLCGATLLQVGTALQEEGPVIFDRLTQELAAIMAAKGYTSIDQFRGKLKSITD